jgi:type VI secretion system secreted protein Hcp
VAIFLKFAPEVKGEGTADSRTDEIVLSSFQFGVGVGVSAPGGSANREASTASFSEIVVTKAMDVASTAIMHNTASRKFYDSAIISFTTSIDSDPNSVFLTVTLADVIVSGYSVSSGGEGRPSESLSLNYGKITMKYMLDSHGKLTATAPEKMWDLATNKG